MLFPACQKKPRRVWRPQAAKIFLTIFSRDMCVRENTSQAASVEFVRHSGQIMRAADCKPFVGKTLRVFRQSQKEHWEREVPNALF